MTQEKSNKTFYLSLIGVYLIASALSFVIFKKFVFTSHAAPAITTAEVGNARTKIDPNLPKTEECPINGAKFTTVEKSIWETRRPITAIIENHLDSRPQSGLSKADVVYEAVAEGGITRFLGVFYCGAAAGDVRIGPVRSERVYFAKWAHEYGVNPINVHVGGANNVDNHSANGRKVPGQVDKTVDAFQLLIDFGWRVPGGNDMDGGTNVGYPIMWRDPERLPGVATEHTFMGSTDKLYDEGAKRGFGATNADGSSWNKTYIPWKFVDDAAVSTPTATTISFEFWKNKPDYAVEWKFNASSNTYMRFNGGTAHVDFDSGKPQLSAKNVVFQFVVEKGPVDKEYHMYYENYGTGKALVFNNGRVIEGTWKRATVNDRTIFYDKSGKEISFVRGVVWIEALPSDNVVDYK